MQETLHDHQTSISIGRRPICNLKFANYIDLMGDSNGGLQDLTNSLIDRAIAYGMEVSMEKNKVMTNSINSISADISMNGQKIEKVTGFKDLGVTLCKDGTYSAEVHIRFASAMARLNMIWWCNTNNSASKFKLYNSLCHLHSPLRLSNMAPAC